MAFVVMGMHHVRSMSPQQAGEVKDRPNVERKRHGQDTDGKAVISVHPRHQTLPETNRDRFG
jgi:hypothetical protein